MPATAYEGGIRPIRLEFVRESTVGEPPSNPSFKFFSDNVRNFDPSGVDPGIEGQRGLGDPDFQDHFTGTGSFPVSVEYDLQEWFSASGDAAYDGLTRDTYNRINSTHTVVRRMEQGDLEASNTVNGSTSKDTRQYMVCLGGRPDTVTIDGDPTNPQPATVTIDYLFEKVEVIQIDQPDSDTAVDVTGLGTPDITIEDQSGTSETLSSDGTTTATFTDIDAIYLSADQASDVTVSASGGDDLAVIYGSDSYDFEEGQRGVPDIGTGSHATAYGTDYEVVQGDLVERPSGTTLADEINGVTYTVENNVSEDPSTTGPRPILAANERLATVDATIMGEVPTFSTMLDALQATSNTFRWTMDGGNLELDSAKVVSTGGEETPTQGMKAIDISLEGTGVTVN